MNQQNANQDLPLTSAVKWLRFMKLLLTVLALALTVWRSVWGPGL